MKVDVEEPGGENPCGSMRIIESVVQSNEVLTRRSVQSKWMNRVARRFAILSNKVYLLRRPSFLFAGVVYRRDDVVYCVVPCGDV